MSSHNASGNPNAPSNAGGGRPRGRARYSVAGDDAALDPPALDEPDDDQRQQYQQHARDGNRGVAQARVAAALADEEDEELHGELADDEEVEEIIEEVEEEIEEEVMDDEQHGQHPNSDAHDGEDASLPEGAADDPGSDQDHKDDGEGDDEEEGSEDDDEDEEPKLKYQRIGNSVASILKQDDTFRCLTAHEKFLVLGTIKGVIHMLDLNGNQIMKVNVHSGPINDLSLDSKGDFVASCSNDGTVVITNLYSKEKTAHQYLRPVNAVALHPEYEQKLMFASGGLRQQFLINTRGWFSSKDNVIHAGEGPIYAVRWRRSIIAWANDLGVKLYDCETSEPISYIARPKGSPPPELFRCNLAWANDDTLLIGWADSVKVGVVKRRPKDPSRNIFTTRYVEMAAMFQTDFYICGIAPYGDHIVLLAYRGQQEEAERAASRGILSASQSLTHSGAGVTGGPAGSIEQKSHAPFVPGKALRPELRIMTRGAVDISGDALPIFGYEHYTANDYRLDFVTITPPPVPVPVPVSGGTSSSSAAAGSASAAGTPSAAAGAKEPGKAAPVAGSGASNAGSAAQSSQYSAPQADLAPKDSSKSKGSTLRYGVGIEDETLFYIVSPKDVVVAKPRDINDHISWLLVRERFEEALAAAEQFQRFLKGHQIKKIGQDFLNHLTQTKQWEKAAQLSAKFLENNAKLWEERIYLFAQNRMQKVIAPYIPVKNPQLPPAVYEMVLTHFLVEDHDGFLETIRKWPHRIYNIQTVITAVVDRLNRQSSKPLMEALGELFILNKQYGRALDVYLQLGNKDVFELIKKLNLFDCVKDRVLPLMTFDAERAIELFTENVDLVPVESVVQQLSEHPRLQHEYLHTLFKRDNAAGSKFHERQVSLYAEFAPNQLLAFLRNSHFYKLEDALKVCSARNLYNEVVFILKRMGNTQDALSIVIEKLQDMKQAIQFVEEQKEDQLWEQLIAASLNRPALLSDLLAHVGSHYVDPLKLMKRIPAETEIPLLKQKLVRILSDCQLQINLRRECNAILQNDCVGLLSKLNSSMRRGIKVEITDKCALCDGVVLYGNLDSITVFFCKHVYHTTCINAQKQDRRAKPECVHASCHHSSKRKDKHVGSALGASAAAVAGSNPAAASSSANRTSLVVGAVSSASQPVKVSARALRYAPGNTGAWQTYQGTNTTRVASIPGGFDSLSSSSAAISIGDPVSVSSSQAIPAITRSSSSLDKSDKKLSSSPPVPIDRQASLPVLTGTGSAGGSSSGAKQTSASSAFTVGSPGPMGSGFPSPAAAGVPAPSLPAAAGISRVQTRKPRGTPKTAEPDGKSKR